MRVAAELHAADVRDGGAHALEGRDDALLALRQAARRRGGRSQRAALAVAHPGHQLALLEAVLEVHAARAEEALELADGERREAVGAGGHAPREWTAAGDAVPRATRCTAQNPAGREAAEHMRSAARLRVWSLRERVR